MKRYYEILKNKKTAVVLAALTAFIIFSFTIYIVYNTQERFRDQEEYEVTIAYYSMVDEVKAFINENVSLLEGFMAYIETIDSYEDESIYTYLHYLLDDKLEDIRNVTVLKDTAIKWIYPLEGNESAIGIDLSNIPEQAKDINRVKEERVKIFVGPVDLVQGGQGFIVRLPIIKEKEYWGMVSIVLRTENTFNFINNYSNEKNLEYLITRGGNENQVIYGNRRVFNQDPLKFTTDENLGGWDIYTLPNGGWNNDDSWKITAYLIGIVLSVLIGYYVYKWVLNYNIAVEGQNDLKEKYIRDRFTGVYTREYFNSRVNEEFSHAIRDDYPISMIYFDLDHFKEVNDEQGHLVGDEVLLEIVAMVETIIRKEDVFARWGGDEFIILMPDTELSSVQVISERIRSKIANINLCKKLGVTVSMGCSEWVKNEYLESWFLRTDKALYKSKRTGKNKVTTSNHHREDEILIKIKWLEEWNSDNAIIDSEHHELLERCNMIIESSLSRSATDNIIINIDSFLEELEVHFKDEIKILIEAGYPNIEQHKKIHDDLINEGRRIYKRTKNSQISLIDLFSFLLNTVIREHLIFEDHKYFEYLN